MDRVFGGQGDHGSVCHHSFQAASQPFPHHLDASSGHGGLSFAVNKVGTPEYLGISMQHRRRNVALNLKEPEIPAD